jgi:6-phosphofructokinase
MPSSTKRIGINFGGGYVSGLNAVIMGAVLAANEIGWEVVGIRDGFDGLLFPERYGDTGLVPLGRDLAERMLVASGSVLGTAARSDPFHVRIADSDGMLEEVDRSDGLLETLRAQRIDAVISVAGMRALSILLKLSRKGLNTVVVPKSIENDMAATDLSFGFSSALSFAAETIDRARQAAEATRQIGVIEVPGEHAGWLALQSGTAVCADAILIPEIPYDLHKVAAALRKKAKGGRSTP